MVKKAPKTKKYIIKNPAFLDYFKEFTREGYSAWTYNIEYAKRFSTMYEADEMANELSVVTHVEEVEE